MLRIVTYTVNLKCERGQNTSIMDFTSLFLFYCNINKIISLSYDYRLKSGRKVLQ